MEMVSVDAKLTDHMTIDYDVILKLFLIGSLGVGKTSLILRYAENTFSEQSAASIGVDYKTKIVMVGMYKSRYAICAMCVCIVGYMLLKVL